MIGAVLRRILAALWGAALAGTLLLSTLSVTGGVAPVSFVNLILGLRVPAVRCGVVLAG